MPIGAEGSYAPVGDLRVGCMFSTNRLRSHLCLSPNVTCVVRVQKTATPCEDLVGIVFIHIRIDSERQTWLKGCGKKPFKEECAPNPASNTFI